MSTEQQFHDLYLKFLDKVNSQQLYKEIVQASYENCKVTFSKVCCAVFILLGHQSLITFLFQVLLGSALIKSDSEERSLLKNLGSWLGKVTIGRNRVLRACEIDPKSLIIDVILALYFTVLVLILFLLLWDLLLSSLCRHMKKGCLLLSFRSLQRFAWDDT